ncbi:DEKNAAC100197 [Brettanomyces naardenensis]|uniref:DEKNAAC100197 n=1 Tax=Brettanomyces naardenensis TaxID=13370 RepID=A0A448YGF0_BRENA|nr:DEKNAAC100197 [Brettanomyces naardenensis]
MDKPFDILSESVLYDQMDFDEEFIKDLKMKHRIIIDSLPTVNPPNLYHDSGYVMIGGGRYTWFAFLAIQALRRTGSKLPVELMIPNDDDWESWLCDEVLPNQYNVKCVTFSSIYGEEMLKKVEELKGYQFKSFALLGSSFENAFYLDSDDFAVKNPDVLFESDLYKKYQMITWPDFWRRTSSPSLYSVLGIKVGSVPIRCLNDLFTPVEKYTTKNDLVAVEERVNYHDRRGTLMDWSTESGQFLFNKTLHFNTLLLSLYYNYDGPAGYHPLISQGGAGEGDKETYTLAAHYLKKMYYQVYKKPDKLYGTFIKASNWYVDSTIVQMDPLVDYENLKKLIMKNRASQDEGKEYTYNYEYAYGSIASSGSFNSEPMFYHIHAPKMDPFEYVNKNLFTNMKDQPIRNFGYDFPKIGFDIELWIWKTVLESLCERSHDEQFSCFEGANLTIICSNPLVESRISWLEETGIPMLHDYQRQNFPESPKLTEVEGKDLDDLIYGKLEDSLDFGYL